LTNQKSLKILHLISQRPDSTGSGIYLQAILREAEANYHSNFLVAGIQSDSSTKFDFIDSNRCTYVKFNKSDISYPIVGMSDVMPYKSTRFCDLSTEELDEYEGVFTRILKAAVARFNPDIIHSHHLWILTSLTRKLFPEIPIVTTCHGTDLRQFQNCPHLQQRVLKGCQKLDAVMALSESQKEEIIHLYNMAPEKISVIGAGYNDQLFTFNSKPDPNPVQLIYAGKLSKAKGVTWFLQALAKIKSPEWFLHLVGDGSGKEKEQCLMLAKKLDENVHIHGNLNQVKLADIMKQSHIMVLPSFFEGLPLVLLEGLASGCRIIATDLPGITDLLGEFQSDFIELVKVPRLHHIDQPYREDEDRFEKDLTKALHAQMIAARTHSQIETDSVRETLNVFSWKSIFNKVQRIYYKTAQS
jgi:glycosyltransferase involved in cell wall biosynthesis